METLILGWYVLVETESVLLLTLFASLQYIGTLFAPIFGVAGHRMGNKKLLGIMRATYAALAAALMVLAFLDALNPVYVFVIAALTGMVRPSDLVMRFALIGETMPADSLLGATSFSHTTQHVARILGALAGAGLVATLGMGPAYSVIACLYTASFMLTLGVAGTRPQQTAVFADSGSPRDNTVAENPAAAAGATARSPQTAVFAGNESARPSPWHDLRDAATYVWTTPQLLAAMAIAFLVNLTAFPLVMGLLPYVAKEIYGTDQTGLGYLVASSACGALLGTLALSRTGHVIRAGRMMIGFCAVWYALILAFAQTRNPAGGIALLLLAGVAQSLSLVPMLAMLLRTSDAEFRGRVIGMRMLAIYSLPIGLMISGPLIDRFGYPATATLYCAIGLMFTLWIALRWRDHLWKLDAPANLR